MDAELLLQQFGHLAQGEGGVQKLRDLILQLAVRGKLVPQDANDEPASELLRRIEVEKKRLVKEGKLKKQKPSTLPDDLSPLPRGWNWISLDCLGEINPRNNIEDDTKIGFVPMTLISSVYGVQPDYEERPWEEVKKGFTHFADRDVGIAKITPCFQNGKAAVFKELPNGFGAGTTELHIFRDVTGELNTDYVYLFIKTPKFLSDGEKVMTGSAGQKRVPKDYIASIPFPLPPLAEQRRIVAKVDALMALCDRLEAEQATQAALKTQGVASTLHHLSHADTPEVFGQSFTILNKQFSRWFDDLETVKRLRATILQLAVQGKLVPQNPSDEPASELLKRIEAEKQQLIANGTIKKTKPLPPITQTDQPFTLSRGWEWIAYGDLFRFIDYRGKTPEKIDSGVRLITAKNIKKGFISLQPNEYVSPETYQEWMTRGFPEKGDILITTEAPLGNAAIVNIEKFALAQRSICLAPYNRKAVQTQFYLYCILSPIGQLALQDKSSGMTATGIKAARLKQIPLPLPPLAEQQRIIAKVDALMQLCDQLEAHITQTRTTNAQLMDSLLHHLTEVA